MALLSKPKKSKYAKDSSILMIGTVVSMVFKTITTFWLAKYLGTEAVADFALYSATSSILLVIATGRYELSIMIPKEDNDGFLLTVLSSCISIIFSVVSMIVLAIYWLVYGFKFDWMIFLPITTAVLGVYYSMNYWLNRTNCYKKLALNRILQGALFLGFSFLFFYIKPTRGYCLILGYFMSQLAVLVILIIYATIDYNKYKIKLDIKRTKQLAEFYINYPKISVLSGVINNLAIKMPIYMLTLLCGKAIAGQYSMMENILAAPITIISSAVGDVFRQRASKDYATNGECEKAYKSTFKSLAVLATVPFVLIMFASKPVLNLVYSNLKWDMAGSFIMIMAPFFYIRFIVAPLSFMTFIANKQSFDFKWQSFLCISSIATFYIGYAINKNPYFMILLYGISLAIMYAISFYYSKGLAMGKYKN